tara:strand:- start:1701 stop:2543 length:843 start_codon:yes stop_codon:yes gene_type:complete
MDLQDEIRKINNSNLSLEEKSKKIQTLYIEQSKINENLDKTNISECSHYNNNCLLYCNICMDYFGCRLCHDSIITTHNFDRYNVNKIKCKLCNTEQDVSNKCINCNEIFGIYNCSVCNLYENENINIFHCDKCNICRKGNKEDFKHCEKCNGCISIKNFDNHKCINNSVESNCPICMESIFYSVTNITSMKCGHYIHIECLQEYLKNNYKCPVCLISLYDMTEYWKQIDDFLLLNPIPEEFQKEVDILCYDCSKKSKSTFHFDYIKCLECNSYNTTIKND